MARVFWLNLIFSIFELLGGLWTGSLALLADALHDFGDALTIGAAYFFEKKADQGPDYKFSYGYRRYSLLSSVLTGAVLIGGSFYVLWSVYPRLLSPEPVKSMHVIGFAVVGLIVNGMSFLQMGGHHNQSSKMIRWHLLEDTAGWAAVFIGAVVMYWTEWYWVDSFLAIAIALWIILNVSKSLHQTLQVFLQGVPQELDLSHLKTDLEKLEGVAEVHDVHVWSLDGASHVLSLHVVLSSVNTSAINVKNLVRMEIAKRGDFHVTVEIEGPEEDCSDHCS